MHIKSVITTLLFFVFSLSYAQQPSGIWVMAHIKAKQPVLSATLEQGELVFDEGLPFDSSVVYTSGLMVVQYEANQTAKSYSWDGNENWTWQLLEDSLLMFGKKDTLFGTYSPKAILVSSTVDPVPTEYTFLKVDDKLELEHLKPGTKTNLKIDDHPFDKLELTFEQDTVLTGPNEIEGLEMYLTTIGPLQVIEYSFDKPLEKVELGIIYLFRERRRKYKGLFYPVVDDFRKPSSKELEISIK